MVTSTSAGTCSLLLSVLVTCIHHHVLSDAKNMARDVQSSLVEIIASEGAMDKQKAEEFIKKLQSGSAPRYLSDVWS